MFDVFCEAARSGMSYDDICGLAWPYARRFFNQHPTLFSYAVLDWACSGSVWDDVEVR